MTREVLFVLGLQGVGKSTYIRSIVNDSPMFSVVVIDYEELRKQVLELYPDPDVLHPQYDASSYYVLLAADLLRTWLETPGDDPEIIIVECTGMTKQNQASLRFMADQATKYDAEYRFIYLKIVDEEAYKEAIEGNEAAFNMFKAWKYGGPKWREPNKNPLLDHVEIVEIDHNKWLDQPF